MRVLLWVLLAVLAVLLGAVAGFLGALLRPRVDYHPDYRAPGELSPGRRTG
ncbi:MAG: hypothetical protein R2737_14325 [Candidatus Nanopelagicales bacterium]